MTTIHSMSKADAVERIIDTGAKLAATLAALDVDVRQFVAETVRSAHYVERLSDAEFQAFLQYVEQIYQTIETDEK